MGKLTVLKGAYGVYTGAKSVVGAVTHPVSWVRDQIKQLVIDTVVKLALLAVKTETVNAVAEKLSTHRKEVRFNIPIPKPLRSTFNEDETAVTILHGLANDALAAPLALVGYSLGNLQLSWDAEQNRVAAVLDLGLINIPA